MFKLILILGSSIFLGTCLSQKQSITYETIRFGSGGGFTGAVEGYELHGNKLSELNSSESFQLISDNEIVTINKHIAALGPLAFDEPANMYRFIELKLAGQEKMKFQWGVNKEVPKELQVLFDTLIRLVK